MASITGTQFSATAVGQPVNVVYTSDGSNLPPPVPGDFNLEVWTGPLAPTVPAAGYQGILNEFNGQYGNLISGAFGIDDTGTGGHYIQASGDNQTVGGAPGDIILTEGTGDSVTGNGNVILSYGGSSTFNLASGYNTLFNLGGDSDTVTGGSGSSFVYFEGTNEQYTGGTGNDIIIAANTSTGDTINAGTGNDLIDSFGQNNTINGGASGSDTIGVFTDDDSVAGNGANISAAISGSGDTLTGGTGSVSAVIVGTGNTVNDGSGNDSITIFGNSNTVNGGAGSDSIGVYGNTNSVNIGSGPDAITIFGANDSVTAGSGNSTVDLMLTSTNAVFVDAQTTPTYQDTIVGFNNSAGDTINLSTNTGTTGDTFANTTIAASGSDTLITLHDGSTILLKGVSSSSVNSGFFS